MKGEKSVRHIIMSRLSSWDTEIKVPAVQFDKKQEGRIKHEEVSQEKRKVKGGQQELACGKEYSFHVSHLILLEK